MAFLFPGAPLRAGTFDVKGVEVVEGESELAVGMAVQHGFPANADFVRHSYEVAYGYGLLSWFKAGVKMGFERPDGEALEASYAGVEAQAVLIDPARAGFGLAWFAGVDFGLQAEGGDVLAFGPLVSFDLGHDLSITLNPLLQKTWNPTTPGIDFSYAWQIKKKLGDKVGLGLEGYGAVPDISDAPSVDYQEHRLGPVLYLTGARSGGGSMELQVRVLFGLTDATADATACAKLAIVW